MSWKKTITNSSVEIGKLNAIIVDLEKNKTVTAKLESENAEFRDRITKVEQRQMLDDNSSNNITSNFFNSVVDQQHVVTHHGKLLEDKEMNAFLGKVYKERVSNEIRQRNKEKKLLRELATQDLSGPRGTSSFTSKLSQDAEKTTSDHQLTTDREIGDPKSSTSPTYTA